VFVFCIGLEHFCVAHQSAMRGTMQQDALSIHDTYVPLDRLDVSNKMETS
jgi:hypothetical protein